MLENNLNRAPQHDAATASAPPASAPTKELLSSLDSKEEVSYVEERESYPYDSISTTATEAETEVTSGSADGVVAKPTLLYDGNDRVLPSWTLEKCRNVNYLNVHTPKHSKSAIYVFVAICWLASPYGVWSMMFFMQKSCGMGTFFPGEDDEFFRFIQSFPIRSFFMFTLAQALFSICTFIPFAMMHDKIYKENIGMRCQPDPQKEWSVDIPAGGWTILARREVRIACLNLTVASWMTTMVAFGKIVSNHGFMYTEVSSVGGPVFGWGYLLVSAVLYFLWIDLWAYLAHRVLHWPFFYKRFHKVHHEYKQVTAFSALALHPVDMVMLQGGVFVGLYLIPLHIGVIAANLLYIHYHNVVDHSGVYHESPFPWQPTSLYHDDHHQFFHVNYGQTLTVWDRIGGTFYEKGKKYGEKRFSDLGLFSEYSGGLDEKEKAE